jgi:hypothetical protein
MDPPPSTAPAGEAAKDAPARSNSFSQHSEASGNSQTAAEYVILQHYFWNLTNDHCPASFATKSYLKPTRAKLYHMCDLQFGNITVAADRLIEHRTLHKHPRTAATKRLRLPHMHSTSYKTD